MAELCSVIWLCSLFLYSMFKKSFVLCFWFFFFFFWLSILFMCYLFIPKFSNKVRRNGWALTSVCVWRFSGSLVCLLPSELFALEALCTAAGLELSFTATLGILDWPVYWTASLLVSFFFGGGGGCALPTCFWREKSVYDVIFLRSGICEDIT